MKPSLPCSPCSIHIIFLRVIWQFITTRSVKTAERDVNLQNIYVQHICMIGSSLCLSYGKWL